MIGAEFKPHRIGLPCVYRVNFFGTPDHNITSNGEIILGYVAGADYKILFVFKAPTNNNTDPELDHYSVLYPKGTVNSMAGDPGREW